MDIVSNITERVEKYYRKKGKWPQYIILNHYTRNKLLNYFHIENYMSFYQSGEPDEKINGIEILLRASDYREELYIEFK